MGQQPLHRGVPPRQCVRHSLCRCHIGLQGLHPPSGVRVQQLPKVDVLGGHPQPQAGVGELRRAHRPKVVHAPAGRLPHQGHPHLLKLHRIDDGGGEGGLSNQAHALHPPVHRPAQHLEQGPDHPVGAAAVVPQVHDHPPVLPRRQVLFHLGGKGLHGQLRILPAAVVLDIVGPFIQGEGQIKPVLDPGDRLWQPVAQADQIHPGQFLRRDRSQCQRLSPRQGQFQGVPRPGQLQVLIKLRHIAALAVLPPQLHPVVRAEHRPKGLHRLLHTPAVDGGDLPAQQRPALCWRGAQVPAAVPVQQGHGVIVDRLAHAPTQGQGGMGVPCQGSERLELQGKGEVVRLLQPSLNGRLPLQEPLLRRVGKQVRVGPLQGLIQELQVLLPRCRGLSVHRSGTGRDRQAQGQQGGQDAPP